jgi:UDP-glucose:(heptosyl)LPS alpha-1,3-glucosyltransferase
VAAREVEQAEPLKRLPITTLRFPRIFREISFARKIKAIKQKRLFDRVVGFRHMLDVDRFQPHEGLFRDALRGTLRPASSGRTLRLLLCAKKLLSPKNLFFLYADYALLRRGNVKIAVLSHRMKALIRSRYARYSPEVTVIPNGVDRKRFFPGLRETQGTVTRKALGIPASGKVLLFIAHNFRLKGLQHAVAGAERFRSKGGDPYLVVAGRGKKKDLKSTGTVLAVENRIRFLGDRDPVAPLYGAADVVLHPTFYDHCSLVVLEALGAGVPVITTRLNGAAELMQDQEAGRILNDPRNHEAMAEALGEILDSSNHARFRENAARLGKALDFSLHVDRMERWITEP